MKMTPKALDVLKNFSTINNSLVVKAGEPVRTISETKSIMAECTSVTFENDFAIYDLGNFLSVLSVYKDKEYELDFKDDYLTISLPKSKSKIKYYFADPDMILSQSKSPKIPDVVLNFDLSQENISTIKNVAGILNLPDFFVKADSKTINFGLIDEENSTSNSHIIEAGECDQTFEIYFKQENLKMLNIDYKVIVSEKNDAGMRLARFENEKEGMSYYISPELKSNFGE